ncbi:MAG: hypothetical protein Q9214_000888 [Letrouitia sp. 1 TL-2023]
MDPERGEYNPQELKFVDINGHYDGVSHWYKGHIYKNPTPSDVGMPSPLPNSEPVRHRDFLGRITHKPNDLARYISPTYAKPFHLIVQSTPKAFRQAQGGWRRSSLRGRPDTLLRLCVWAAGDLGDPRPKGSAEIILMWLKVCLIIPAEVILLLPRNLVALLPGGDLILPGGDLLKPLLSRPGRISDSYPVFFSRSWDYPRYARNILDASPDHAHALLNSPGALGHGAPYDRPGDKERLLEPRKLMIKQNNGQWELSDGTDQAYIVVSYTWDAFEVSETTEENPKLERIAEDMAKRSNVRAYWIDYRCVAKEPEEKSKDIHRICDVFRGARQVYVALLDLSDKSKKCWGSRMWCLPEAQTEEYTKLELASQVWNDGKTTRLLAEHFTGLLTLSRLELITLGLEALCNREKKEKTKADVAYALMSLLRYRPHMDPEVTLFQALARLSLANDSDRIVERAVCLLPNPNKTYTSSFVLEDILGAELWDIEPLCQVSGVGDENEIFLDGCRGASIRWKNAPRIYFHGRNTWKKRVVAFFWRTAPIWFGLGLGLLIYGGKQVPDSSGYGSSSSDYDSSSPTYSSYSSSPTGSFSKRQSSPIYYRGSADISKRSTNTKPLDGTAVGVGVFFLLTGLAMLLHLPWAVQRMHSGKVWGSTPWLIGFEGVLPIKKIERTLFGNAIGRLSYAPSSSLYSNRCPRERIGKPPAWSEDKSLATAPPLPDGHRWFTLIDTGPSMHVHIFSARMPPSVALVCGKEGGMLRVVLCSFETEGNLLRKETVLRMETPMLSLTKTHSWIRLSQR